MEAAYTTIWTLQLLVLNVLFLGACQPKCVEYTLHKPCSTSAVRFQPNSVTNAESADSSLCFFWTEHGGRSKASNMKSSLICNNQGHHLCLSFQFICTLGNVQSLQALSVRTLNDTKSEPLLIWFIMCNNFTNWNTASVPIQTNADFHIVFESRILNTGFIDVKYLNITLEQCTVAPAEAAVSITKSPPTTNRITTGKTGTVLFTTESTSSKNDDKEQLFLVAIIAPVATVTIICFLFSLLLLVLYKRGKLTCCSKAIQDTKPSRQESNYARKPVSQNPPGLMTKDNTVCNDGAELHNGPTGTLLESHDFYSSINDRALSIHHDEAVDMSYQNVNNNPTSSQYTTHDVYSVVEKSNQGFQNEIPPDILHSQARKPGSPLEITTNVYANSSIKETVKQPIPETTSQDVYAVVNKSSHNAGKAPVEEHPVSQDVYAFVSKSNA